MLNPQLRPFAPHLVEENCHLLLICSSLSTTQISISRPNTLSGWTFQKDQKKRRRFGGPNPHVRHDWKIRVIIIGVSKNRGGFPPKWMVKIMENPIEMDDLGGFPLIFGNTNFCQGVALGRVRFFKFLRQNTKPSTIFHPDIPLVSYLRDLTWSCLVLAAATHFDSPKCAAGMERGKVTKVKNEGTPKMPSFILTPHAMLLLIEESLHHLGCIKPCK